MKIVIGGDHAGFEAKQQLIDFLNEKGHEVVDVGPFSDESCDYPDFAEKTTAIVSKGECEVGILCCGSGIGMSMAANRVRGIRAALCHNAETARLSRSHNNANILCVGARVLSMDAIQEITTEFLKTEFEGGRHARRVAKIDQIPQ
jgi:ribose 5-phosphate isomerase B